MKKGLYTLLLLLVSLLGFGQINFSQRVFGNGATDAFGSLRVSQKQTLFDAQFTYSLQPYLYQQCTAGTGATIAMDTVNKMATMRFASTTTGGYAYMQTYEWFRYQPGKGQLALITFDMHKATADVKKFAGIGDSINYIRYQLNGTTSQFEIGTSTGSGVQTVAQSGWNIDKLNGQGGTANPSGIRLDSSTTNILFIQYQALYVGEVVLGFNIGGQFYPCHKFDNANVQHYPYIATANLPIRVGMTCTGTVTDTLDFICCSVMSEGGDEAPNAFLFSTPEGTVSAGSGVKTPILSLRPRTNFGTDATECNRTKVKLESVDITVTGNFPVYWELVNGCAFTGGNDPSWANVNTTYSSCQYGTGGVYSAVNGVVIASGYIPASAQQKGVVSGDIGTRYPIALNADCTQIANNLGMLTILVTGVGGASNTRATLNFKEIK